jgi:hypothetical protein
MVWRIKALNSKGWVEGENRKPIDYPTKKAAEQDLKECFVHPKNYEVVEYKKTRKKKK